jgi:hypothetical protein
MQLTRCLQKLIIDIDLGGESGSNLIHPDSVDGAARLHFAPFGGRKRGLLKSMSSTRWHLKIFGICGWACPSARTFFSSFLWGILNKLKT